MLTACALFQSIHRVITRFEVSTSLFAAQVIGDKRDDDSACRMRSPLGKVENDHVSRLALFHSPKHRGRHAKELATAVYRTRLRPLHSNINQQAAKTPKPAVQRT